MTKYLTKRRHNENGADPMAQDLVALWFEQLVVQNGDEFLRLLFVFKILTPALDFTRSRSAGPHDKGDNRVLLCWYEQNWDDVEIRGWKGGNVEIDLCRRS